MGNPFASRNNRDRHEENDHPSRPKVLRWWPFKKSRRNGQGFLTPISANGSLYDVAPWSAPAEVRGHNMQSAAPCPNPLDPPGQRSRRPSYTPRYAARDALLSVPSSPAQVPRRSGSTKSLGATWTRSGGHEHPPGSDFVHNSKRITKGGGRLYDPSTVGPWATQQHHHQGYLNPGPSSRPHHRNLAHSRSFSTEPNGVDIPAIPALPQDLALMSGALPLPATNSAKVARASHCAQQRDDPADLEQAWEMVGTDVGEEELAAPLPPLPAFEGWRQHVRASRSMGVLERGGVTPKPGAWMAMGMGRNFSRPDSPAVAVAGVAGKGKGKAKFVEDFDERPMSPVPGRLASPSFQNFGPALSPPPRRLLPPVPQVDPPSAAEWFSETPTNRHHDNDDEQDAQNLASAATSTPTDLNSKKIRGGSLTPPPTTENAKLIPTHPSPKPPPLPPPRPSHPGDAADSEANSAATSMPPPRSRPVRPKRSDEKLGSPVPVDSLLDVSARSSKSGGGGKEVKGTKNGGGGGWI